MVVREHQLCIYIYFDVSEERQKKPKTNEKSRRDEKKRKVYNYNQQQLIEKEIGKERDVQFAKL